MELTVSGWERWLGGLTSWDGALHKKRVLLPRGTHLKPGTVNRIVSGSAGLAGV